VFPYVKINTDANVAVLGTVTSTPADVGLNLDEG
jgi:hypothetical protein